MLLLHPQGMRDVYSAFAERLQRHLDAPAASGSGGPPPAPGVSNSASSSAMCSSAVELEVGRHVAGETHASSTAGGSKLSSPPPASHGSSGSSSSSSSGSDASGGNGGDGSWAATQALIQQQFDAQAAEGVLQQAEAAWPAWSAAGCRLKPAARSPAAAAPHRAKTAAAAAGAAAAAAPSPEQAAAVLQQVARRALKLPLQQRQQELAKHRVVRGLVEALQLPTQRKPMQATAAPAAAATGKAQQPWQPAAAAAAGLTAACGAASGLESAGSVAAALWALAVLGGSIFWVAEAEALCALLPACTFTKLFQVRSAAGGKEASHFGNRAAQLFGGWRS
jgi:hypothetical protein